MKGANGADPGTRGHHRQGKSCVQIERELSGFEKVSVNINMEQIMDIWRMLPMTWSLEARQLASSRARTMKMALARLPEGENKAESMSRGLNYRQNTSRAFSTSRRVLRGDARVTLM